MQRLVVVEEVIEHVVLSIFFKVIANDGRFKPLKAAPSFQLEPQPNIGKLDVS